MPVLLAGRCDVDKRGIDSAASDALTNRLNHRGRPKHSVTTGEHTGSGVSRVNLSTSSRPRLVSTPSPQIQHSGRWPPMIRINLDDKLGTRDGYRTAPSTGIWLAQLHAETFNPTDPSAVRAHVPER